MTHFHFDEANNGRKSFELPGAKPHYNPDRPGQVEHIFLDLVLDLARKSLQGTCTLSLKPVRANILHLTLDAVDLEIESVTIEGIAQPFDYDGERLQIELLEPTTDKTLNLAIAYSLEQPQRGIYFIEPDEHYPNKPTQVWTQGEDEDSRYWFPCFDYPGQLATSEIRVRVPQPYIAISNGKLIATETLSKEKIYHWKQEQVHPSYLIALAVGDFAEIKDKWKKVPVTYYVEKGREPEAQLSLGKTPEMITFLSAKYGYPYPFPKYAQVCVDDFIFGGMENTSTTILTDRCLLDERAAMDNERTESLVVHELAHQWFGDLVVIKHWSHAWLKEGAASYSEVQWTEFAYGQDEGAYYLLNEARSYLSEDRSRYRRPMVTHVYREAIELYDRHLYEKGACVYHMIRALLGNELFDKAIKTFLHDNAHKTVETIDLLRAIEKATGKNIAFLFDQYVYRGGHPEFKVSYAWDSESKLARVTVKQTQAKEKEGKIEDLFELTLPVSFGFVSEKGKKVKLQDCSLRVDRVEQSFYFPLSEKPQFFSFDTGNAFLKTVSLDYGMPELKAQLKHDPDAIGRIYAAIAIAKKGGLEAIKVLADALTHDPFWGVRVEAAKQLAKIKLDRAVKALINGLKDEDSRVRRAALESLGKFKQEESYKAVKKVASKGDTSYYVEASAIRVLGSTIPSRANDKQEEVLQFYQTVLKERAGWNEIVRCGAIAGLSQMKTSPVAADTINEYTQLGVPQPLRLAAIRALGAVSSGQTPEKVEEILEQLETLSAETFYLAQVSVANALGQMQVSGAIAILQSLAEQTPDGRVRRIAEDAIAKVQNNLGGDKNLKQLRDDLERLKQENQDLKSRLEKLEAQK